MPKYTLPAHVEAQLWALVRQVEAQQATPAQGGTK